jgi:hypothetical protein
LTKEKREFLGDKQARIGIREDENLDGRRESYFEPRAWLGSGVVGFKIFFLAAFLF